ncbi:radical SAM/SPASM domain-containing protein [Rhizobium leguminosarum]|uniref:radical SAM/SPASM domain-containing protein n=1 Tax=Rhizobium leguminosarum TaxID=384 RepID=UPI001C95B064|nr:radical SAM protein [Rhizobium leguminosarum]MBY5376645.1 SPASM domain-containing protein [Rhizobium leguminosarum]
MDVRAEARIVRSDIGAHLFLADGSRLFDIDGELATELAVEIDRGILPETLASLIGQDNEHRYIADQPIAPPALRSISLNVAQACNMSCGYCYADRGHFGGRPSLMQESVARKAIDRLIAEAPPESDLVIAFMGGEPFINRPLIHAATEYAYTAAHRIGHRASFSLTTNATLLTAEDAQLLARYPFSVTVSLDGDEDIHNGHRTLPGGKNAYARAIAGIALLTQSERPRHLSIRATVSPKTGALLPLLDHFFSLGVDDAGFAPVVSAPPGFPVFTEQSFAVFTVAMLACGERAKRALLDGARFPFSNFQTALREIHRGVHRPYPCGAGAGYMSVSAKGEYFACHRLVDDADFRFGSIDDGFEEERRAAHLTRMHVDQQEPCRSCWARYLCGGGCYHEVARRGRQGCDYIRSWLEFCLVAYAEVSATRPNYFFDRTPTTEGSGNEQ